MIAKNVDLFAREQKYGGWMEAGPVQPEAFQ